MYFNMKKTLFGIVFFLLSVSTTFAIDGKKIKASYKKATVVFTGNLINKEIIQTEEEAPFIESMQSYIRTVYTFEITEWFKGVKQSKTIKIVSKHQDFNFKIGNTYLVYSFLSMHLLTSNFYLNGEKVTPFLAVKKASLTRDIMEVSKKEIKKLRKLAKRERKRLKKRKK